MDTPYVFVAAVTIRMEGIRANAGRLGRDAADEAELLAMIEELMEVIDAYEKELPQIVGSWSGKGNTESVAERC